MTFNDILTISTPFHTIYAYVHEYTTIYAQNKGHKSGWWFLETKPFGLKLRISVDNYPMNKMYNDF